MLTQRKITQSIELSNGDTITIESWSDESEPHAVSILHEDGSADGFELTDNNLEDFRAIVNNIKRP